MDARKHLGVILTLSFYAMSIGQTRFEVEGTSLPNSDPVVEVKTKSTTGFTIGLSVQALSNLTGTGIAGRFTGSSVGIVGEGFNLAGVQGGSEAGAGVKGTSQYSFGGHFTSEMKNQPDLVIGGNLTNPNGVISSDPDFTGSSLFLRSNNSLLLQLDKDDNSDGFLTVQNGKGSAVLFVGEEGDMALAGNSNLNRPHLLITETESNDFARVRLKSTSTADYWDIAGGSALNGQLNFYRSNVGNILQLNAIGNPITTSTGAYLSSGGVWTSNSSATLKNLGQKLDGEEILKNLSGLDLYTWNYKVEPSVSHLGPTAEDFYALFECGDSEKHLAASDMAAVALAAIQGLIIENEALRREIETIKESLTRSAE